MFNLLGFADSTTSIVYGSAVTQASSEFFFGPVLFTQPAAPGLLDGGCRLSGRLETLHYSIEQAA